MKFLCWIAYLISKNIQIANSLTKNFNYRKLNIMKALLKIFIAILFSGVAYGQESFKKNYFIKEKLKFEFEDVHLMKEITDTLKFSDFTDKEKETLRNQYKIGSIVEIAQEKIINGQKVNVISSTKVDEEFYQSFTMIKKRNEKVSFESNKKSSLKFEEDKIYINPYLSDDIDRNDIYFYKLKNRQTAKICFREATLSALVIPVKYRFKKSDIPEEFSASLNMNIFLGYSLGMDSFFHQKKIGNKVITKKITFGAIGGISTVKLTAINTSLDSEPITEGREFTKGLASAGFGLVYSYNKFNIGAFIGSDYAVGEGSNKWNYQGQPWVGFALGYGLFNF